MIFGFSFFVDVEIDTSPRHCRWVEGEQCSAQKNNDVNGNCNWGGKPLSARYHIKPSKNVSAVCIYVMAVWLTSMNSVPKPKHESACHESRHENITNGAFVSQLNGDDLSAFCFRFIFSWFWIFHTNFPDNSHLPRDALKLKPNDCTENFERHIPPTCISCRQITKFHFRWFSILRSSYRSFASKSVRGTAN